MMLGMSLMLGEPPEVDPKNRCGNCEYFDNRMQTLKALNIESGTGACTKFKFVCSQEKSCQGWDSPDKHNMEQEGY